MNRVVAAGLILGRCVAQHELGSQFFSDLGVDVVHRVLLFDLKVASPSLLGDFLKDLLAVGAVLLLTPGVVSSAGITTTGVATRISPPGIAPSRVAPPHATAVSHLVVIVIVVLVPSDIYGVNDS